MGEMEEKKGLLLIYTGNGKGKTTAAFGQALRASGHGMKVCIIQFIKAMKNTGEAKALAALSDNIELHTIGIGFTWNAEDMAPVRQAARDGWRLAMEKMYSGRYDMLILDEMTYALNYDFLDEYEVLDELKKRPATLHVVITGRDASQELMVSADLVTKMDEVKHPYQSGRKASRGIEF